MGIVFAISLIACYIIGFNELQAYNAASALEYYIPDYATNGAAVVMGIVLTLFTALVIFGGAKRISVINSWVVPIMAIAYLALGKWALKCLDDYSRQRKEGADPVFSAASIPGLPACQCWNEAFDAKIERDIAQQHQASS